MFVLNERASEAVSTGVSASRRVLSFGNELLCADREATLKSATTVVEALRSDTRSLQSGERLTFDGYHGIEERHQVLVQAIGELVSYGRALEETLRPSFSDLRDLKHRAADAMVAAAENLNLNDRRRESGGSVLTEGAEEKGQALGVIRRVADRVERIQSRGVGALGDVREVLKELTQSVPGLVDAVRGGQFGINEGIKGAVTELAATSAKLLGSLSLIEDGKGMGPLDWRKVQGDSEEFLKASQHPVFKVGGLGESVGFFRY